MDIQTMWLGNVLLACMVFMTSGTYGDCYDDSLSLYVTDDGYIRVRLTSPDTVDARGTIQTRCGLRCACFDKMFLCCSDADCITVDHHCPPHHLNFPPESLFEAPPIRTVRIMDQSTKVTLDPRVIHRPNLQPHLVVLQNLDPIQGHNLEAVGDQTSDSEIPALVAHAQPQMQTVEKSSAQTGVTISQKGIPSSGFNEPDTHLASNTKPILSTHVSRSDQVARKGRLNLLEVLRKDMFNGVQDQDKELQEVTEGHAEAGVDTASTWRRGNVDSDFSQEKEKTTEEIVMHSVPTELPADTSPASQSLRRKRSENTDTEDEVTHSQTKSSDSTPTLELRRKKRSDEIIATEQLLTTEEVVIPALITEAPYTSYHQMPPLRKKRSDENIATEQLLTTEEVVIPALITEAPYTSYPQMAPLRKKRSDEIIATEELLTTEDVIVPALPTEAPHTGPSNASSEKEVESTTGSLESLREITGTKMACSWSISGQ